MHLGSTTTHCVLVFFFLGLIPTCVTCVLVCIHRLQAGQHQVYDAGRHVEEDSALQYCDPPRGLHHQSIWRPLYEYERKIFIYFFYKCVSMSMSLLLCNTALGFEIKHLILGQGNEALFFFFFLSYQFIQKYYKKLFTHAMTWTHLCSETFLNYEFLKKKKSKALFFKKKKKKKKKLYSLFL